MEKASEVYSNWSVEEYIQNELKSDCRHEYVNGQLIEMLGEKAINNKIAGFIYIFLMSHLYPKGYQVFNHDVKVSNHDRTKYFYPDVFITHETENETNQYIKIQPGIDC